MKINSVGTMGVEKRAFEFDLVGMQAKKIRRMESRLEHNKLMELIHMAQRNSFRNGRPMADSGQSEMIKATDFLPGICWA